MTDSATDRPTEQSRVGPWTGLGLLLLPLVVLAVDVSVLFLATPAMTRDLDASATEVLWITDVYGFFIAGFLIVMGAVGDRVDGDGCSWLVAVHSRVRRRSRRLHPLPRC